MSGARAPAILHIRDDEPPTNCFRMAFCYWLGEIFLIFRKFFSKKCGGFENLLYICHVVRNITLLHQKHIINKQLLTQSLKQYLS